VASYLSPGGFRGQKVNIPAEHLSEVKRKIRSEYRVLGVSEEDMPKWIKEASQRDLLINYTPLTEAKVGAKDVARVVIIKPGWGNPVDNHYYPEETLKRDYAVFEGSKMYANHQTEDEEQKRPEGDIKEWVATLKNVTYQEGIGVVGDAYIIEDWLKAKLSNLRDKDLLGEMGISIRAAGIGTEGMIEGKKANIVEKIVQARSVDFVTEAGAGGAVLMYENDKQLDVDVISLDILKEHRPDLVKYITDEVKSETMQEVKKMSEIEEKVKELEGKVTTLTSEKEALQGKIDEADKAKRVAEAKSKIDEAISKSELPDAAKTRISGRFSNAETADGIEEAIKDEIAYVKSLTESGKVKGLGNPPKDAEKAHKELVESFKRLGLDDKQAEEAAR
jgi:hypothetical protein